MNDKASCGPVAFLVSFAVAAVIVATALSLRNLSARPADNGPEGLSGTAAITPEAMERNGLWSYVPETALRGYAYGRIAPPSLRLWVETHAVMIVRSVDYADATERDALKSFVAGFTNGHEESAREANSGDLVFPEITIPPTDWLDAAISGFLAGGREEPSALAQETRSAGFRFGQEVRRRNNSRSGSVLETVQRRQ